VVILKLIPARDCTAYSTCSIRGYSSEHNFLWLQKTSHLHRVFSMSYIFKPLKKLSILKAEFKEKDKKIPIISVAVVFIIHHVLIQ
jgi:hypothetical protein